MHEQNTVSDAAPGPQKKEEEEEEEEGEEGGVTGLILQPLYVDLRSGRGIELDPSPATKKWGKKKNFVKLTIQTDQFSHTLQQFTFHNFLYWKKEKRK